MAILTLALLVVFFAIRSGADQAPKEELKDEQAAEVIFDQFGIEVDSYTVQSGIVGHRHTLSHILSGFGLTAVDIDQLAGMMQDVFNPRRIRTGQSFHGYYAVDGTGTLAYFVYEISDLDYLKVDFSGAWSIERHERDIHSVSRAASGVITSSLWNTLASSGLHPELAIRMAEILAWEVDFYRIQAGDRFKVIFNEDYVDDQSVGISRVDAIYFMNYGREIYGFHFKQDTVEGFFAPDGENLRKVFLKAPLEFGRITSRYSHSRLHPILNQRRPHLGTDYAAPHGTPILAVGDGVVTRAAYHRGNGNYVRIRHNSVYETQYLHMSRFAAGIRPGVRVTQGQVIGYVGSTGLATGPHVCFRFWKNGQQVDHLREEFPSADPLPEDYHESFSEVRDRMMHLLNHLSFQPLTSLH